ncbi:MAG: amidohydrolase family protein [Candidatus Hodarchaeales archaeon]
MIQIRQVSDVNALKYRLFDSHTHFFPSKMFERIWGHFETKYWPIYEKGSPESLARSLITDHDVSNFVVLNYAHKEGIAQFLNNWTHTFCSSFTAGKYAIPVGTIHPDDKDRVIETERILETLNFAGIKLQLMVTSFYISDKRLLPVYQKLLEYDRILIVHVGTGPDHSNFHPNMTLESPYVGIRYLRPFLEQFPELKVIVPHLGANEFHEMWMLIEDFPNLYFDTAMVGVQNNPAFSDPLADIENQELTKLADRLLFGTDFPNIPYSYQNAINSWLERRMNPSFYHKLFYENAKILFRDYI